MRVIQVSAHALALCLISDAAIYQTSHQATADEPDRPAAAGVERLATQGELDAVNLNLIDEKLALSLAAEAHIQIELTELALPGIRHDELKRLSQRKLRLYRQLLNTLEELTGGQSGKILARATHKTQAPAVDGNSPPTPGSTRGSPKPGRKGGIGDVVQNVTTHAILRVRLEIADEYFHLVRAELSTMPPDEYDRRYLGIEEHNQTQMLAMLRVFEKQASPEFSRIIRSANIAAESCVTETRQLVEQLRNPGQNPPASSGQVVHAAEAAGS